MKHIKMWLYPNGTAKFTEDKNFATENHATQIEIFYAGAGVEGFTKWVDFELPNGQKTTYPSVLETYDGDTLVVYLDDSLSIEGPMRMQPYATKSINEELVKFVWQEARVFQEPFINNTGGVAAENPDIIMDLVERMEDLEEYVPTIVSPEGPQGPVGPAGPQGETGPQGPQGIQGPAGQDGVDGYTPIKGIDYFDGEVGPMGPQGPIGLTGPQGLQGEQGIQGIQGPKGDIGDTGPQGPAGTNGVGVPTGGTAGQVLAKIDGTDYNTEWVNAGGGGNTMFVPEWVMTKYIQSPYLGASQTRHKPSTMNSAYLFFQVYDNLIYKVSVTTGAVLGSYNLGAECTSLVCDENYVYAACISDYKVYKINISDMTISASSVAFASSARGLELGVDTVYVVLQTNAANNVRRLLKTTLAVTHSASSGVYGLKNPVLYNGVLYVLSYSSSILVTRYNADTLDVIGTSMSQGTSADQYSNIAVNSYGVFVYNSGNQKMYYSNHSLTLLGNTDLTRTITPGAGYPLVSCGIAGKYMYLVSSIWLATYDFATNTVVNIKSLPCISTLTGQNQQNVFSSYGSMAALPVVGFNSTARNWIIVKTDGYNIGI